MPLRPRLLAGAALLALAALPALATAQAAPAPAAPPAAGAPALIPQPRELAPAADVPLARGVRVVAPAARADDRFAAGELVAALGERGVRASVGAAPAAPAVTVRLLRADDATGRALLAARGLAIDGAMREEGYVLVADRGRVDVVAASGAGVFYGVQTLVQLVEGRGAAARVRGAVIRDWPAMRWRGLHDDLSRGPVPTVEFQKRQIRTFAAYKLNAWSPYFEHTLAYAAHPLAAPPGGAMTAADVKELVAYAKRYHLEVIPEQEAFGHLHHVVKWERYAPLAETTHGHVLAPGQAGSLALIRDWFREIDSLFPGRFVHLGADETFELGRGQTAERVKSEGIGRVYLDFLARVDSTLRDSSGGRPAVAADKRFLFWGDVAMNHPDLVKGLPKDLIAVAWWYDPQASYDRYVTPFRQAGIDTWVAPGVNNWNRVYPNYANALVNIRNFVRDGQRLGATGMLNTTWDDDGEALFAQAWYGVAFGAAAAWQPGESSIEQFQGRWGRTFHGDTTGALDEAQRKLAAAHELLRGAGLGDASDWLFWTDPWGTEGRQAAERIRPVARDLRLLAEDAIALVARARAAAGPAGLREGEAVDALELGARRVDAIGLKFQLADEIVEGYARARAATTDTLASTSPVRDLGDITGINGRLQDLRDVYATLRDGYETAWRRENRPYFLHAILARYDMATQLWIERADRVNEARRAWYRTRGPLPAAAELGIPEPAAAKATR